MCMCCTVTLAVYCSKEIYTPVSTALTDDPFAPDCTISCRLLAGKSFSRPLGMQALQSLSIHKNQYMLLKDYGNNET